MTERGDRDLVRLAADLGRFQDYTMAGSDWTWEADADGRFTEISEAAREVGIDPARLIGLDRLTELDSADEVARRQGMLAHRRPFRDLSYRYDWEGFTLNVLLHGVPVHGPDGTFRGFRGCARDMTRATPAPALPAAQVGMSPAAQVRAPARGVVPELIAPLVAPKADIGDVERLDILVVEDDAVNRLVIGGFLRPFWHTVTFAVDGEQGVAEAQAHRYDLVLMDVMMPGIDGPTATRMIRALPPPYSDVPIIALTANAMPGDRERYLAGGMNDHVTKPIDRAVLFATIERVLGRRAFGVLAAPTAATAGPDPGQADVLDALTESLDL
jgi:CheY-like chemotaxis protein